MDWPGLVRDVTTWEGNITMIYSVADQWMAALPSGSRGKDGNQVESSLQADMKCFSYYFFGNVIIWCILYVPKHIFSSAFSLFTYSDLS